MYKILVLLFVAWAAIASDIQYPLTIASDTCHRPLGFSYAWGSFGDEPGQFKNPVAVAVDRDGNVHVTDRENRRIQTFTPQGQYLLEYGNEDNRVMLNPNGIEVGPSGFLYIADTDQHRILRYNAAGQLSGGWQDGDGGDRWRLREPWGVAGWDEGGTGNVYVVDHLTCQILRFQNSGQFIDLWGSSCSSADWLLSAPQDIATYAQHSPFDIYLYIADTGNDRIAKYDYRLNWLKNWGTSGIADGEFKEPSSVATDKNGCVYVADSGNNRIQIFDGEGNFVAKLGGAGELTTPRGLAIGPDSCIYVADTGNQRIAVFCQQHRLYLPNLLR
ncbi:MAG: NHL repeat-containing protein [Caldilineaceae bacterium]|nr:NHL repeat-containing protein [Caldilineaceae bacterium]HRJ40975.1 NHL repeat-containing protein [Caldilineaceae bacterium]